MKLKNKIQIVVILTIIVLIYACSSKKKFYQIKYYLPDLYFSIKKTRNQAQIIGHLKKDNFAKDYFIIGYSTNNALQKGVYQFIYTDCNHCRTDNYLFFLNNKIDYINDSLIYSRVRFKEYYKKMNGDTQNFNKLYLKMSSIKVANDKINYNF